MNHLSGGRFEIGVGAGWNREEMRNHGTDPRKRMKVLQERVEAMKAIWTQHEASYSGEFVNFERIWSYPSRHSAHTHLYSSAATDRPSWIGYWHSVTRGSRATAATKGSSTASMNYGRAPTA